MLLAVSGLTVPLVLGAGGFTVGEPRGIAALLGLSTLFAAGNKLWWTVQGSLFNQVVEASGSRAHAVHLQLLNSLSNLGKLWPRPLAFGLMERLGFLPAALVLSAASAATWPALRRALSSPALRARGVDALSKGT